MNTEEDGTGGYKLHTSILNLTSGILKVVKLKKYKHLSVDQCQSRIQNRIYRIPRTYIIYKSNQIRHCLQNEFIHLTSSYFASNTFFIRVFILSVELLKFNYLVHLFQFWKCKIQEILNKFIFWFVEVNIGRLSRGYMWVGIKTFNILLVLNNGTVWALSFCW